jgi:hypothetical protein
MSHRYGERFPARSEGHSKPSLLSASFIHSNDQEANALATSAGSDITTENATATIPKVRSSLKEASNRSRPLPSPEDMNSCTLAQARAHLREVVIEKGKATGQAKEDLETRRFSLSEHITRLERAESKKRDAARRGEVFHLRLCYVDVVVKNTKLLLLLLLSHHRARRRASTP